MEKRPKKQTGNTLARVLFLVPLLLFLAVAGLAVWGLVQANTVQAQSPLQAVQSYLRSLEVGDFEQINRDSGFLPSALCGWRDYDEYLRETYGDDFAALTISDPAAEDGTQVYTVSSGGAPLAQICLAAQDGGWRVFTVIDEDYRPYTVIAPAHVLVAAGGLALSPDSVVDTQPVAGFEDLSPDSAPALLTYETPPLFAPPEVTYTAEDGRAGQVVWEEDARRATVTLSFREEALEAATLQVFARYMDYQTGEADFEDLAPSLLPGTALHDALAQRDEDEDPALAGSAVADAAVRDMTEYSETAFSAQVDYHLIPADEEDETPPRPGAATLYFVQNGDGWLLAAVSPSA